MKILVLNAGSSSLKYQLFNMDNGDVLAKGLCECIGSKGGCVTHKYADNKHVIETELEDHEKALSIVLDMLLSDEHGVISSIDEIGVKIAQSILNYFANEENRVLIARLKEVGLNFARSEEETDTYSDKLAGKSIVISGVFTHHSRDEYKEIIEKHGGKNVGSISAKTSFILAGENMGPAKLEKAQKLGIHIMSEDEFLSVIS